MSDPAAVGPIIRFADLRGGGAHSFSIRPDAAARAAIATGLGIVALKKLRFEGRLAPLGKTDWRLTADLGATVVQDCVVTLAPVTTRIDETVERSYLATLPELGDADEIEMPEDETVEPLPATLDLGEVMTEALSLALPAYPHAEGVDPLNQSFAAPGTAPMSAEEAKPFAGLAALRDQMGDDEDDAAG